MPTWFVDDPAQPIDARLTASASLVLLSETLDAETMSSLVPLDPDATWERGEKKHPAGRYSGVRFESRLPSDASPSDHLSDLLTRLDPVADRIASICQDERVNPRLWLSLHINNWNPGLSLTHEQLRRIAVLGSGLEIDIYTYTDSDDSGGP